MLKGSWLLENPYLYNTMPMNWSEYQNGDKKENQIISSQIIDDIDI